MAAILSTRFRTKSSFRSRVVWRHLKGQT